MYLASLVQIPLPSSQTFWFPQTSVEHVVDAVSRVREAFVVLSLPTHSHPSYPTYRCVLVFELSQELVEYIIERTIIAIDTIIGRDGLVEHVDKERFDGLE